MNKQYYNKIAARSKSNPACYSDHASGFTPDPSLATFNLLHNVDVHQQLYRRNLSPTVRQDPSFVMNNSSFSPVMSQNEHSLLMRYQDSQQRGGYTDMVPNLNFLKNPPEHSMMAQNHYSGHEMHDLGGNRDQKNSSILFSDSNISVEKQKKFASLNDPRYQAGQILIHDENFSDNFSSLQTNAENLRAGKIQSVNLKH